MIVAVMPENPRALPSNEIVKILHDRGSKAVDGRSVKSGLQIAMNEQRKGEPMVIIGSHYVAGEALKNLNLHH